MPCHLRAVGPQRRTPLSGPQLPLLQGGGDAAYPERFPQLAGLRGVPPLASWKASVEHRGPGLVVAFTGRGASVPHASPLPQSGFQGACQGPREAGLVSLRP